MSSRSYHQSQTQGVRHTYLPITVLPQNTSAPKLGEGDPNGSFFTVTRTGVGAFTLATKDPFVAVVNVQGVVTATTQAAWSVSFGAPTQNADNTWSFPFTIYDAGTATDLAAGAGDRIAILLVMRNSSVVP